MDGTSFCTFGCFTRFKNESAIIIENTIAYDKIIETCVVLFLGSFHRSAVSLSNLKTILI